ncbi:hypothetical protein EDB84DRAFT_1572927 [Lactarius hengduanensis]|nr:hypothetical protein EDB84DRAFT_1572927 [Lactarius hengduanensis]
MTEDFQPLQFPYLALNTAASTPTRRMPLLYSRVIIGLANTEDLDVPKSSDGRSIPKQLHSFRSAARLSPSLKKTHRTSDNLVVLEEALNATFKALQEAIAAVAELKTFNLEIISKTTPLTKPVQGRRDTSESVTIPLRCLGDWSQEELLIADAIRKDKERMDWLNRLLQTRPPLASQVKVEQIELTVAVYDGSTSKSNHVHQTTFLVEGSTRLSAVRWTVAGALAEQLRKRARLGGEFRLVSEDTECELHDTVSQVAGSKKKYTLKLIV